MGESLGTRIRRCRLALAAFGVWALISQPALGQDVPYQWDSVPRIVAVGDVHGAYENLTAVLRTAGLIDDHLRWIGGKTHLVQTGDVVDRGPDSRKCMDLLMELERQAEAEGGRVHVLIGNHEAMNVVGLLDFVTPEELASYVDSGSRGRRARAFLPYYKRLVDEAKEKGETPPSQEEARTAFETKYPLGYIEHLLAFRPDGPYGRWVLGHNVAVRINGMVFSHGDWNLEMSALGLAEVNRRVREELSGESDLEGGITFQAESPLQYRGFSHVPLERVAQDTRRPALEAVLTNLHASRIVVGHTVTRIGTIESRFDGKHISVDAGMLETYEGGHRVALEIEGKNLRAIHPEGRVSLPSSLTEATLVDFLAAVAEVDPANATVHLELAKTYRTRGEIDAARKTLEKLRAATRDLPARFHKMLGDVYAESRQEDKAREQYLAYIEELGSLVDADPREADLATALAQFCLEKGMKLAFAAERVQEALESSPHHEGLLSSQSRLEEQLHKLAQP